MAISKQKKEAILEKVTQILKESPSVVFVNFHGLSVSDDTQMRSQLRERGVGYYVAKKTLVRKALENSSVSGTIPALEGELALAYPTDGDDVTAPARGVYEFGKKHEDRVSILGGIFERTLVAKDAMEEIATIPPKETLYGRFVNVINSPIQGLVVGLNKIAQTKS